MVVWLNVVHDRSRELFFNTDLHNWIKVNIADDIEGIGVENWKSFGLLLVTCFGLGIIKRSMMRGLLGLGNHI
jgi:hypothetical protein